MATRLISLSWVVVDPRYEGFPFAFYGGQAIRLSSSSWSFCHQPLCRQNLCRACVSDWGRESCPRLYGRPSFPIHLMQSLWRRSPSLFHVSVSPLVLAWIIVTLGRKFRQSLTRLATNQTCLIASLVGRCSKMRSSSWRWRKRRLKEDEGSSEHANRVLAAIIRCSNITARWRESGASPRLGCWSSSGT